MRSSPMPQSEREGGGFAATHSRVRCAPTAGDASREGYGAAPPASRLLAHRPAGDGPAGPALTPETSAAPQAGNTGRSQPAPPAARRIVPG